MVVRWVGGFCALKNFHADQKWVVRKRTERSDTPSLKPAPGFASMRAGDRLSLDRAAGLLSFDKFDADVRTTLPRFRVLWLENRLDCRIWSYYCDLRKAVAQLHDMVRSPYLADLIVVGPRMSMAIFRESDPLGISRQRWAHLPLVVIQNKMYACTSGEFCGGSSLKLEWARQVGSAAAFTWLTRHHEFTQKSLVHHHWMPFGVDPVLYGRFAGLFDNQTIDVAFTGTSDRGKYPLRTETLDALARYSPKEGWNVFIGSWTPANRGPSTGSDWQRFRRAEYVKQIARSKIWISTTGPDWIVGTRYFEVLASGTTLLLCNRPPTGLWVTDGLFEEGVHVAMYSSNDELRSRIRYYLTHEAERRRVVKSARELTLKLHSWEARARFITAVVERANRSHPPGVAWYRPPKKPESTTSLRGQTSTSTYAGCFAEPRKRARATFRATNATANTAGVHDGTASMWDEQHVNVQGPYPRGFNVSMCEQKCAGWPHFALICGGFCSGDVHYRGRCVCGQGMAWRRILAAPLGGNKCESTCSLHDDRPCGAAAAMAVYNQTRE